LTYSIASVWHTVQAVSEAAALRAELEITQREAESLAEEYERCEGITVGHRRQ
jgi:hypothetical protein